MGKIVVFLDRVSHLVDADIIGTTDPYVKFHLEQDNAIFDKNYGKKTSTKKKGDQNPVYGETFEFDNVDSLKNLVLWGKVMDDDIGVGNDDKLGSCKINLADLGLSSEPMDVDRVVDRNLIGKNGRIYLKISWHE